MSGFIKNFSYTFISNIVSFLISAIVTFVVPKQLGVESYGYFQLYLFYITYTNCLHFGWADGVFLRYGGEYYENLDCNKFSGQFWLYVAFETVVSALILGASLAFVAPVDKMHVVSLTGVSVLFALPKITPLW